MMDSIKWDFKDHLTSHLNRQLTDLKAIVHTIKIIFSLFSNMPFLFSQTFLIVSNMYFNTLKYFSVNSKILWSILAFFVSYEAFWDRTFPHFLKKYYLNIFSKDFFIIGFNMLGLLKHMKSGSLVASVSHPWEITSSGLIFMSLSQLGKSSITTQGTFGFKIHV